MPRLLAIDYGGKRCGIAVTDTLQIICTPLDTIETPKLMDFLTRYLKEEEVETIVLGYPTHADGNPTHLTPAIEAFEQVAQKRWPEIPIVRANERATSKEAEQIILMSGYNKKKRQDKSMVDRVSASLILSHYMDKVKPRF